MRVKLGRKAVRCSDDQPIAVLFTDQELQKFKSLPPGDDIFLSFPSSWTQQQAQEWMEQIRDELIPRKAAPPAPPFPVPTPQQAPPAVIPFVPPSPEATVVEDDELLGFLKKGTEEKPKPPPPPPEPEPESEKQTVSDEDIMKLLQQGVKPDPPSEEPPPKAAAIDLKATFEIQDGVATEVEQEKDEEDGGN
jgi:hypothetical protein